METNFKSLLTQGARCLYIDTERSFFPGRPYVPGAGELPIPDAEKIIDPINSVTGRFGRRIDALLEEHPCRDAAYFASTYCRLGLAKKAYSQHENPADYTLTLEEFQQWRRGGVQFPFDADRFERHLHEMGGSIVLWNEHAREGTPGAQMHPGFTHEPSALFYRGGTPEVHPIGNMEDAGLIGRYQHDQVPAVFVAGISENGVLERTLTEIAGKGIKTFYFVDGIAGVQMLKIRQQLQEAGITGITTKDFIAQLSQN